MITSISTRTFRNVLFGLCVLGILVCMYAYHVETSKERDSSYRAFCDLSSTISCSKVFTSRYGRGFGLVGLFLGEQSPLNQPNSVFGIIFYCILILTGITNSRNAKKLAFSLSVVSNCGSCYLAYILFYVLNDFCVVCVSMYAINFCLFFITMGLWRNSRKIKRS